MLKQETTEKLRNKMYKEELKLKENQIVAQCESLSLLTVQERALIDKLLKSRKADSDMYSLIQTVLLDVRDMFKTTSHHYKVCSSMYVYNKKALTIALYCIKKIKQKNSEISIKFTWENKPVNSYMYKDYSLKYLAEDTRLEYITITKKDVQK